jgi:hypothetical protein
MFKEQHGFLGHILGGWGISGNYVIASGQPYTASQFAFNQIAPLKQCGASGTASCNFFDSTFFNGFIGVETDRPFVGNLNAPATSVGIFCGDAIGAANCGALGFAATDLLSLNALNTTSPTATTASTFVKVTSNDVKYIANTGIAETVFGTPFGNAPRNGQSDAITNIANASLYKKFKLGEHASFEFHATALNVFNHMNFQTIDPFIEDALAADGSNRSANTGFGDPSVTGSTPPGFGATATRRVLVGGTIRF